VRFRDQCHIQDKVHFLGHREDVPRLLPHLDVVWCTSAYEGQSNALMEAMAAGVPVVATDIAPNRELIEPGRTGLLFPVGDRASLARYTQKLLEDQQLASRLGQAAAEHMRQNFSVQTMLTRYAQLYRNLFATER
jgi:glycosyltransferase involved in cell wall biosynthesis